MREGLIDMEIRNSKVRENEIVFETFHGTIDEDHDTKACTFYLMSELLISGLIVEQVGVEVDGVIYPTYQIKLLRTKKPIDALRHLGSDGS